MKPQEFQETFNVSRETMDKFKIYEELLIKWQKSINLVSNSTINDIWYRHFTDSFQLWNLAKKNINNDKTWIDLGSGAGFPGLVISIIAKEGIRITLVESNGKKASFLREVKRQASLDVTILNDRIENLTRTTKAKFDFVSARALTDLKSLFSLSFPISDPNTTFLWMKGKGSQDEIKEAERFWHFDYTLEPSITDEKANIIVAQNLGRI